MRDVTRGTTVRARVPSAYVPHACRARASRLHVATMDDDHEVSDSEPEPSGEDTGSISIGDASHSDSDPVSPSEESNDEDDSSEELTGVSLAPYSFEPSDSDSASASPDDDDDDARDERLSDLSWYVVGLVASDALLTLHSLACLMKVYLWPL